MQANPEKFQFLAVGRKTYDKNPSIHIQNFDFTCERDSFTCKIKILNMNGWIFVISFSAYSQKLKFFWISLHLRERPFNLKGVWFFSKKIF
jgi:hypothetical protein